jgi:hypothetical protein
MYPNSLSVPILLDSNNSRITITPCPSRLPIQVASCFPLITQCTSIYLLMKCHILPYGVECIYIIMVQLTGPIVDSITNHLTYIAHNLFVIFNQKYLNVPRWSSLTGAEKRNMLSSSLKFRTSPYSSISPETHYVHSVLQPEKGNFSGNRCAISGKTSLESVWPTTSATLATCKRTEISIFEFGKLNSCSVMRGRFPVCDKPDYKGNSTRNLHLMIPFRSANNKITAFFPKRALFYQLDQSCSIIRPVIRSKSLKLLKEPDVLLYLTGAAVVHRGNCSGIDLSLRTRQFGTTRNAATNAIRTHSIKIGMIIDTLTSASLEHVKSLLSY